MKKLSEFITDINTLEKTIKENKEEKSKYFFKNLLFFSVDVTDNNDSVKQLYETFDNAGVKLYLFDNNYVSYKLTKNTLEIFDNNTRITLNEESNLDTVVFTRGTVLFHKGAYDAVNLLEKWGFLTINSPEKMKWADNKYKMALILQKHNIPQPRFTLLTQEDVEDGMKSLSKKIKDIYPDFDPENEKHEKLELVIKILNGCGGTGVFMTTCKQSLAILQALFAIDPERELIMQKKEELDGGDIRVHVVTLRDRQKIIATMKRKKLGKDFRSNVSLGAEAEPIEITKEQEQIALNVAKASGLVWVGVDIAPLVKGSNPEVGDNVVLEYNDSPGTEGITGVMKENIIELLFSEVNNVNEIPLYDVTVGFKENVLFNFDNTDNQVKIEAKLDTGNGTKYSTLNCKDIKINGNEVIAKIKGKTYKFNKEDDVVAKIDKDITETRIVVTIPCIQIGKRKLENVKFCLTDNRSNKLTDVLINRDILSKLYYIVSSSKQHVLDSFINLED